MSGSVQPRLLAVLLSLVAATTSCARQTSLPDGVSVDVYQTRSDVPAAKLEIRVTNQSGDDLTVNSATLRSPQLAEPAVWERTAVVPAGQVVDLKVVLPPPTCDAAADSRGQVTLDFVRPGGEPEQATVVPGDPFGQLPDLTAERCLARAVADIVMVELAVPRATPRGRRPITLVLRLTPTGREGSVTFVRALPTVLFALSDRQGRVVDDVPLALRIGAAAPPRSLRLHFVAARCDVHALADDKRGTQFPVDVSVTDGPAGRISIPVSDEARSRLYAYVVAFCATSGQSG